jgi:hypothetical protein
MPAHAYTASPAHSGYVQSLHIQLCMPHHAALMSIAQPSWPHLPIAHLNAGSASIHAGGPAFMPRPYQYMHALARPASMPAGPSFMLAGPAFMLAVPAFIPAGPAFQVPARLSVHAGWAMSSKFISAGPMPSSL